MTNIDVRIDVVTAAYLRISWPAEAIIYLDEEPIYIA